MRSRKIVAFFIVALAGACGCGGATSTSMPDSAIAAPHLDSLTPVEVSFGASTPVTAKGAGFGSDVSAVSVLFDGANPTAPTAASGDTLQFVLPTTIVKGAPGSTRIVQVTVQVASSTTASNALGLTVDY